MLSSSSNNHRKPQELSNMISSFQLEPQSTVSKPSGMPDITRKLNFHINCINTNNNNLKNNKAMNTHKRHFSLDTGMKVNKPHNNKRAWYNESNLEGMPEGSSLNTAHANTLFDGLMGEKLDIKEALEGIDDKTLNGLVQVVETKMDENPNSVHVPNGNNNNMAAVQPVERHYWTPIQRVHQMNECWAMACTNSSNLSIPAVTPFNHDVSYQSQGQPSFGSMPYWQSFVEEFFEADPNTANGPVNSPSDIGLLIYTSENAIKGNEKISTNINSKRPYFIPRPLIARFFWTMAGGLESTKVSEPPMISCRLTIERVKESFANVKRVNAHSNLILFEAGASTLQVIRSNGLQTEQHGNTKLWFSTQGKIVRWEWTVEESTEWKMAASSGQHSGHHGKSLKLVAGFTPRTWAVLELAHLTKTYTSIIPFVSTGGTDVTVQTMSSAKRPIPRVNKLAIKRDDARKETSPPVPSPPQPQTYPQSNTQSQQSYPQQAPLIQPNLASILIHSLQQQQAAINKLHLQMTAFMAAYAPPNVYQNCINPTPQQYPQPQQPPTIPVQDHVFSNYIGPDLTSNSFEKHSSKKTKNTSKKSANNNSISQPPRIPFNNTIELNNFIPLSPPVEEDCIDQFLIDDYSQIDHNDVSSLLLGPALDSQGPLDLGNVDILERLFGVNPKFGPPS